MRIFENIKRLHLKFRERGTLSNFNELSATVPIAFNMFSYSDLRRVDQLTSVLHELVRKRMIF